MGGGAARLLLALILHGAASLRMTRVEVPSPVPLGGRAQLSCFFRLEPGERIYTVNWYRNGQEFYRFSPGESPPVKTFSQPGVFVDAVASNMTTVAVASNMTTVVLRPVTLRSSGRFRCEIATEAPTYVTVHGHGDLSVVAVPTEGPQISGDREMYRIGEPVHVNCTSAKSRPAASLKWYINNVQADPDLVRKYPATRDGDGLDTSRTGLMFRLRPDQLQPGGVVTLRCAATIASLYWRSDERQLHGPPTERTARTRPLTNGVDQAKPGVLHTASELLPVFLLYLHQLSVT
ncbi:uncharacterized protein LOC119107934 [Pollicipes pollicipes]|uniref:uncharacterized protein LOC119107934 n=1 Tax=Pollicipes pollicipes TaxID=41117 RepID=UPI001885A1B8|nr:uncharacterized protein LOC119107934 [Pollicipes pollicipes]